MKNIAIASFMHESNTFLKRKTKLQDFKDNAFLRENEIIEHFKKGNHELTGFIHEINNQGNKIIPTLAAIAMPSGTIEKECFDSISEELVERISNAATDGLQIALHGATVSEEFLDADGEILQRLRKKLGDKFPIVCTLDKHANISTKMFENADMLVVYRTCPHLDTFDRGVEASKLMNRILENDVNPSGTFMAPPMIINMTKQNTFEEPTSKIIEDMDDIYSDDSIISASFALGFPFADVPEMGSSFIVYTDSNTKLSEDRCRWVASRAWKNRSLFNLEAVGLEEAVKIAIDHNDFPVILNDIGDNTGGGSSADSTFILHEIIKQKAKNYCTVFFDSESVEQCISAGIGAKLSLKIGGKVDDQHGDSVNIEGIVSNISDGKWTDSEIRHGGYTKYNQGETVLFETENEGSIIITTLRMSPMSIGQLTHIGIDPKKKKIITARGVILPRPAYDPIAAKTILVNTKGSTTADLKNLNFGNISRNLYPMQDSKFKPGLNEI